MTNTTNKNTTASFEDKAVKGTDKSAAEMLGTPKPLLKSFKMNTPLKRILFALLMLFLLVLPIYLQGFNEALLLNSLVFVGLYVILALGLNIVVGYAGMLDFGRMAFYAVGAYAAMLFSVPVGGWAENLFGPGFATFTFPFAVVFAGAAAAFVGWLLSLPVMRLRGDYLAIVTLGFGEIVRITLQNNPFEMTGGSVGLPPLGYSIPFPPFFEYLRDTIYWTMGNDFIFTVTRNVYWYYVVLALLILAVIVVNRQDNSRLGRSWAAMREDEVAATAMGVNVTKAKTLAFIMGAIWGGVAGACFGFFMGNVSPEPFFFFNSVMVLAVVVIGGMGSIPGVIFGGLLIVGVPEVIRWFATSHMGAAGAEVQAMVSNMRNLLLGLVMVLMMALRPHGIIPMKSIKRKLYGTSSKDGDKSEKPPATAGAAPKGGAK